MKIEFVKPCTVERKAYEPGDELEVADELGQRLCEAGYSAPVSTATKREKATVGKREKRAR